MTAFEQRRPGSALRSVGLLTLLVFMVSMPAQAQPVTQTLAFESECLDLDAANLVQDCETPEGVWDVIATYHAHRDVHAVVIQNQGNEIEIAVLDGAAFSDVTSDDATGVTFSTERIDWAFDGSFVLLVRTDLGAVFKLGNANETALGVTLDYERL